MRDDERRNYEADVFYAAWRRGLDPDRATECADDCYWNGRTPTECVDGFARKERDKARDRREAMTLSQEEQQYQEQPYPEEDFPEES